MKKLCEYCNHIFDAQRKNAKYCSEKCRKLAFLNPTENAKNGVSVPENAKKDDFSVLKMKVSVPVKKPENVTPCNDKEVSVPVNFLHGRETKKVSVLDDPYSPDYDLSEEGFIRRNKNWMDFSEGFRKNIRKDAAEYKKIIVVEKENFKLAGEGRFAA